MRWLLHGSLTSATAEALRRHGHESKSLAEAGLADDTSHREILEAAKKQQLDLLTSDQEMAQAPFELDFWFDRSLVYLQVPVGDVEQDDAIDRLFKRYKRLAPKRLYTVTASRVKIRQLPGKP